MVSSKETTPAAYLASLPPEHRGVIAAVRALITKRLPKGYVETMNWGMLAYEIPLARFPDTYNKQPLMYLALAAQKNNYALYMTGVSGNTPLMARLEAAYKAAGKKLDMGKSCLRFKSTSISKTTRWRLRQSFSKIASNWRMTRRCGSCWPVAWRARRCGPPARWSAKTPMAPARPRS